jgi:hypothetical protein
MADETEEVVIVKVDEEPPAATETKTEVKAGTGGEDAVIGDLAAQYKALEATAEQRKKEIEDERRRRAAAERETARARMDADAARSQVATSNLETISTALASANAEVEAAKREIVRAGQEGDYEAQGAAYERLAAAKALSLRYDEAKADLESRRPDTTRHTPERVAEPKQDPVEAYISNRTERTASWLREHTDYITDSRKNSKLTAAHYDATGEGLQPDTDEYFQHVERFLGLSGDEPVKTEQPRVAPARRPTSPPRAPVTGASATNSSAAAEVRLTAREAQAAQDGTHVWNYDDPSPNKKFKKGDPIGIQEFARRKRELTKSGAYDRTYETQ